MLIGIIAIYIIILLVIWGFFIVARMHSLKFKNFSINIEPVTNILMILLIVFSISGFIFIFYIAGGSSNYELQTTSNKIEKNTQNTESNKNYENEIIGDDYY